MSKGWSDDASRALWTLERAQGSLLFDPDGLRLLSRHALPDADPTPVAALLLTPTLPPARALADAIHAPELNLLDEGRLGRWARRVRELSARPPNAAPPAGRWRRADVGALARRGERRVADLALALGHARALEHATTPQARDLAALALRQHALLGRGASLDPLAALTRADAPLDLLAEAAADPIDPLAARAAAVCLGWRGAVGRAGALASVAARAHRAHHLPAADALTLGDRLFALVDPLSEPIAERVMRAARRAHLLWGEGAGVEIARHAAARHSADSSVLDAFADARDHFTSAVADRARQGELHAGAEWLDAAFAASNNRRAFELVRALRALLSSRDLEHGLSHQLLETTARASLAHDPSIESAARALSELLWEHVRGEHEARDASVHAWHIAPALLAPGTPIEPILVGRKQCEALMRSVAELSRPLFLPHWALLTRHAASCSYGSFLGLEPMLQANVPLDLLDTLLERRDLGSASTLAPQWDLIARCMELDKLASELSTPLSPYLVWDFALGGAERFALVGAAFLCALVLDADLTINANGHDAEDISDLFAALGLDPPAYDFDSIIRAARDLATPTITSLLGRPTGDPDADLALCALIRNDPEDLDAILSLTREALDARGATTNPATAAAALHRGVDLARWLEGPDAVAHDDDLVLTITSSHDLRDALASSPLDWNAEPLHALRTALEPLALIVCVRDADSGALLAAARVGVSADDEVVRAPWSGPLAHDVGLRALADDAVLAHAHACGLTPSDTASPLAPRGALWTQNAPWRRQVAHAAPLPHDWPRDLASVISWELRQAVLFEDDEAILQLVNAPDPEVRGAALSWRWRRGLSGAPWLRREQRVCARAEAATPTDLQRPSSWLNDLSDDPTEAGVLALRGGAHASRAFSREDVIDEACEHIGLPLFGLTSLHIDDALTLLRRFDRVFIRGSRCLDPFTCNSCKSTFPTRGGAITALVVRDDGVGALARALDRTHDLYHLASLAHAAANFPCDAIARAARASLERAPDGHYVSHELARVLEQCARPEDADAILSALARDPSNASLASAGAACGASDRVLELFELPDAPDALARVGHLDPARALKRLRRAALRAADGPLEDATKVAGALASLAARLGEPAALEQLLDALAMRLEPTPHEILSDRTRALYDDALAQTSASPRELLVQIHAGVAGGASQEGRARASEAARALAFSGDERFPVSTSWTQILRGCWPSSPALFTDEERGAIVRATLNWRFLIYPSYRVKHALDWASFGAPLPGEQDLSYHCFLSEDLELVHSGGTFALVYSLAHHPASDYARALLLGLASENVSSVGARVADLVVLESGLEHDERLAHDIVAAIPWEPNTLEELSFLLVDHGSVSPTVARLIVERGARHVDAAGVEILTNRWRLRGPRGRWAAAILTEYVTARAPS